MDINEVLETLLVLIDSADSVEESIHLCDDVIDRVFDMKYRLKESIPSSLDIENIVTEVDNE